jgi:hypothetical protein
MNWTEFNVGGYCHKAIWDNPAEQIYKRMGVPEDGDAEEMHAWMQFSNWLLHHLDSSKTLRDDTQFIVYSLHQCYIAHKLVSGNHTKIQDRVVEI